MTLRTPRCVLATFLLVGLAAACSGGSSSIAKAKVEAQTADQLAEQLHQPKPDISCPGDLDAKVGAKLECELSVQGDPTKLPVHIVVDNVKGDTVHFSIEVGDAAGDKAAFCAANDTLDKATSQAASPSDLLPIFKREQATLDAFNADAPPEIKPDAEKLYNAATSAVSSNDASSFGDSALQDAGKKVDAFCGKTSETPPTSTP